MELDIVLVLECLFFIMLVLFFAIVFVKWIIAAINHQRNKNYVKKLDDEEVVEISENFKLDQNSQDRFEYSNREESDTYFQRSFDTFNNRPNEIQPDNSSSKYIDKWSGRYIDHSSPDFGKLHDPNVFNIGYKKNIRIGYPNIDPPLFNFDKNYVRECY